MRLERSDHGAAFVGPRRILPLLSVIQEAIMWFGAGVTGSDFCF